MAYNFQYVPPSGDLSGLSFESQTAIAINELGTQTDETERSAGQALAVAQNAQTTANDALVTAQNADGNAGNARLAADQAIAAAGNAQTDAAVALERANNAYDTAEIAGTTAGSALAGAQTATETANNAQAEAATANQNAEQAVAMAQGALAAASIDNGLFTVDATLRDADEAYRGTEKSYLTSTDEDGPNVNFPDALAFPAYFEVLMSDEGGAVMQRCWQDGGTLLFTRFASVDDSDPDNPVVTWTAWNAPSENSSTGSEAETTADAAKAAAAAQATADAAKTAAATAQTTANTANTTANAAKTTADTAKTDAAAAKTTAGSAQTAATAAQTTANTANAAANTANTNLNNTLLVGKRFNFIGQGGQPSWLWGGNDGVNMYVYNPANFSVNYANSAAWASYVSISVSNTNAGSGQYLVSAALTGGTSHVALARTWGSSYGDQGGE